MHKQKLKSLGERILDEIDTRGLVWRVKPPKAYPKTPKLGLEELQAMHKAQHGKCANIGCAVSIPLEGRGRAVDHCHQTGALRGLLCSHCNTALGFLYDDPRRIIGLLDYLGHIDLPGFHKYDRLIARVMEGPFDRPEGLKKFRKIKVKDPEELVKLLVDLDPPAK